MLNLTLNRDAVVPLVLLEEAQKGTLTSQSAAEVVKAALSNASVQTAKAIGVGKTF